MVIYIYQCFLIRVSISSHINHKKVTYDGVIIKCNLVTLEKEILVDRLNQPHSIYFSDDDLYFADFKRGVIAKYPYQEVVCTPSDTYPRGIAKKDNYLYIGESVCRYHGDTHRKKNASVLIYDTDTGKMDRIELNCMNVYDILILEYLLKLLF